MRTPTLGACVCRVGRERDNCPTCEGTGQRIDFRAIRHAAQMACTSFGRRKTTMITECFEPVRPLAAPEDGCHAAPMVFGGWRVYYGDTDWPSQSYWLVPFSGFEHYWERNT